MIEFAAPWAWWFLPLPLLVRLLWGAFHRPQAAIRAPLLTVLTTITGKSSGSAAWVRPRRSLQWVALIACWCLIVTSLARPQWLAAPMTQSEPARDVMIAVDLSASMEAEDFGPSTGGLDRLCGVKQVLKTFVQKREHDRLGLIVFGSAPYLQVPFTRDRALFLQLLNETRTRMAGARTMLGDAIGLAVTHFEKHKSHKRVLLLLTDGNDSGSRVPPREAAKVARDLGVTIHTIAVGDPAAAGEQALDLPALASISQITGGSFFHARSSRELSTVYEALDQLEPSVLQFSHYRPRQALYVWPLGAALVLQLLLQLALIGRYEWVNRRRSATLTASQESAHG